MPMKLDREAVCRSWDSYVRCMSDLMGLRDWQVAMSKDHCSNDADAQVDWIEGTKSARIRVSDEFLSTMDEERQREVIAHELAHLHFELARVIAERAMGNRWEDFRDAFEVGIDAMSMIIGPKLPLPSHVTDGTDTPMEIE